MLNSQFQKARGVFEEYPKTFWTLVGITFIDHLGGSLLFPFFALYITRKFEVGMTEVGVLFALFSVSSFIGSMLGGALTDRIGRRGMLIFSLIATSFSSVLMGLVNSLYAFYLLALLIGVLTDTGGPARQAMVADLLPEEKRAQGFGIIRVAFNVSVAIGPVIGGFIAQRSYLALFIADAVISLISAILVAMALPETKPEAKPGTAPESIAGTFGGYFRVLRNRIFMLFVGANIFVALVYMNFNTTLGVYLRDTHGIPESGYGWLISLNAIMVVLMQFPITRRIEKKPPLIMMALGSALYAVGFVMYGFVSAYIMFMVAMAILTIGEMLIAPVSQALVAHFSPEDMRGRYMAVYGFSWGIPFAVGPYLAGLILDNFNPNWLWYACGIIGMIAVAGFLYIHRIIEPTKAESPASG